MTAHAGPSSHVAGENSCIPHVDITRGHLVRRHVDVGEAATFELIEPCLQAHELGHEVLCRAEAHLQTVVEQQSQVAAVRRHRHRLRPCPQLRSERLHEAGSGAEPRRGELPGGARRRLRAQHEQVVHRLAVEHVEHTSVVVDDAPASVGSLEGGHGRALAELDLGAVREVGVHLGVLHPRDRLEVPLGRVGVGAQHGRPLEVVDDGGEAFLVGVHGALDLDVVDGEQRRTEHRQGGDHDEHQPQAGGGPPQPLAPDGPPDGDAPVAEARFDLRRARGDLERHRLAGQAIVDEDRPVGHRRRRRVGHLAGAVDDDRLRAHRKRVASTSPSPRPST